MVYRGPLPSDQGKGGRSRYKRLIRKEFHKQLRELWRQQPALKDQAESFFNMYTTPFNMVAPHGPNQRVIERLPARSQAQIDAGGSYPPTIKTWLDHVADSYNRLGTRFVPLISKTGGFTCSLDVLFMRRDAPGNVVVPGAGGGDIDNRLKTLFDALKMPERVDDLGGIDIDPEDEDPFFCLLTDDGLITRIAITSDRLLTPKGDDEKVNDVHIVVHVTMSDESSIFAGGRLV